MIIGKQIALYLDSVDIGTYSETTSDGNIYVDMLPAKDNVISIFHRSGGGTEYKIGYHKSKIQIIYRGNQNPLQSMENALTVFNAINGFKGNLVATENIIIHCSSMQGQPESMGQNDSGQFEYTMNFLFDVKE